MLFFSFIYIYFYSKHQKSIHETKEARLSRYSISYKSYVRPFAIKILHKKRGRERWGWERANGRNHWSEYREKSCHENRGYVARFRIRDNGTFTHSPCPFVPRPFFHSCFLSMLTLFDAGTLAAKTFSTIEILNPSQSWLALPSLSILPFSFSPPPSPFSKPFPFFFLTSSPPFCVFKLPRVSISLWIFFVHGFQLLFLCIILSLPSSSFQSFNLKINFSFLFFFRYYFRLYNYKSLS